MQKFRADELYARDSRSGIGDIFVFSLYTSCRFHLTSRITTHSTRAIFYGVRIGTRTFHNPAVSRLYSRRHNLSPPSHPFCLSRELRSRLSIAKFRESFFPVTFTRTPGISSAAYHARALRILWARAEITAGST